MMQLWSVPSIKTGVFWRNLRLWLARHRGNIRRTLHSEWISPVFWLVASAFGVWLIKQLQQFDQAKFGAVFHGWTLQTVTAIFLAIFSVIAAFIKDVWSIWPYVIIVYVLVTLIIWALQARKRVVIEEFVDYTNDRPQADKTPSPVDGLATLLVVKLVRLHNLYHNVNEQRAIPTSVWVNHSIDATIDVGNLTEFLKDAISVQSELSLGPLKIPIGLLFSFIGHLVRGPRIIGSLHKDNRLFILTAQRFDSKQSLSWQVDAPIPAGQPGQPENDSLKSMADELACRMFTDLSLSGSVRWRATFNFSEGLRAYRECLRSPKDRKVNLELAEKRFIETLAEDQKFDLAYYNLGVVYTELGQSEAAESAFMDAICQNHASWNAYYALALIRFQSTKALLERARLTNSSEDHASAQAQADEAKQDDARLKLQYESVIELCNRVIDLNPDMANSAKAFQLRALVEDQLFELASKDQETVSKIDSRTAVKSRKKAIAYSWRALCRAELLKQEELDDSEHPEVGQLETLASICLANQAEARLHLGEKLPPQSDLVEVRKRQRGLERARVLLNQALSLIHTDPDYYAYYHYLTGETYFELGQIYQSNDYRHRAVCEYEQAIRIIPDRADFWASLALAQVCLTGKANVLTDEENTVDACEKVLDYAPFASNDILQRALNKTNEVANQLQKHSATLRNPETLRRIRVMQRFLVRQKEVPQIVEALRDGEYTIEGFVRKLENELAKFDTDTHAASGKDPNVDKEDRAWGYALIALELGKLDDDTARDRRLEKRSNQNNHQAAYAQGFLSLGNLDASDARLRKITEYHSKAIEKLEEVLNQPGVERDDWERGQIQRVLGLLHLDLEEPDAAEECFRQAISYLEKKYFREFKPYKLRVLLARTLLLQDTQKKNLQALQEVKQGLAMDPLDHREREVLGDVYFRLKEFNPAICAWQDALLWRNARLREPATPTLYYKIGNAHVEIARHHYDLTLRKQALQEAVEYLKKALDLYRSDQKEQKGLTSYLLGTIHMALGEYWEAIACLRLSQMFEFAPLSSTFSLGYAYFKNREFDESLMQFESLLKKSEQWKIQRKSINSIVEADSRVHICMTLGEILALAKWGKATVYSERDVNLQDALALITEAWQHICKLQKIQSDVQLLFPARYEDCMGWLHFKLGTFDKATECLNSALMLSAHAEIYLHLALVSESQMQSSNNPAEIELYIKKVRAYCLHVQELDINGEWDQQVKDLLLSVQEKSQEVQRIKAQQSDQPTPKNGASPLHLLLKEVLEH